MNMSRSFDPEVERGLLRGDRGAILIAEAHEQLEKLEADAEKGDTVAAIYVDAFRRHKTRLMAEYLDVADLLDDAPRPAASAATTQVN